MNRTLTMTVGLLGGLLAGCADGGADDAAGRSDVASAEADSAPDTTAAAVPTARMTQVLDELAALGGKPITELSAPEARQQPTPADAVKALLEKEGKPTAPEPVGNVADRTIRGPGGAIPIRIYTPAGAGPFPVVVYYHGGGWVIADLDTYDASARALTNAANAVVVSSHYRQAPEHKFPAAHQDAFAAYRWALANAASLKGDTTKIAVVGESAGGNLAAAVAMMARDSGVRLPVHQVLVYPIADHGFDTESYREQSNARPLDRATMQWFFEKYLASDGDGANPMISLVRAPQLQGLPPATIINAELDPLRSEGEMYAAQLRQAGVAVEQKTFDGVAHEFFGMGAVIPEAKEAVAMATRGLKKGFGM